MMVNSSATSVIGLIFGAKTVSYHSLPLARSRVTLVIKPARNGIPR